MHCASRSSSILLVPVLLVLFIAALPEPVAAINQCCHVGPPTACLAMLAQVCEGTDNCHECAQSGALVMAGCTAAEVGKWCAAKGASCNALSNPYCSSSKHACERKCKGKWDGVAHAAASSSPPASFRIRNSIANSVAKTSLRFISFTLDLSSAKFRFKEVAFKDPVFLAVSKTFAPAILRVGGTASDNAHYDMVPSEHRRQLGGTHHIPPVTLNKHLWDMVNTFAKEAGWSLVFGLNSLAGWPDGADGGDSGDSGVAPASAAAGTWDSSNARELIAETIKRKHPVIGWELANEPNLNNKGGKQLTPAMLAARFHALHALLRQPALYGKDCCGEGTKASPYLIGPDVTKAGFTAHASDGQTAWAVEFLSELAVPLDILTWHHYYATGGSKPVQPADFTSESFLNTFLRVAAQASVVFKHYCGSDTATADNQGQVQRPLPALKQLWLGETAGAGSAAIGSDSVIGKALGIFWYADKLGAAARTGHSVVALQQYPYIVQSVPAADGGGVKVTPEFWVAQLWRRVMGRFVLDITETEQQQGQGPDGGRSGSASLPGSIRVYAHAGTALDGRSGGQSAGACTALIINLQHAAARVALSFSFVSGSDRDPQQSWRRQAVYDQYSLTAHSDPENLESTELALNGKSLVLAQDGTLPALLRNGGVLHNGYEYLDSADDENHNKREALPMQVQVPKLSVSFLSFPACGANKQ